MSPSHDILGPLGRYDHPWEKKSTNKQKTKENKLTRKINAKFQIFADRSLRPLQ